MRTSEPSFWLQDLRCVPLYVNVCVSGPKLNLFPTIQTRLLPEVQLDHVEPPTRVRVIGRVRFVPRKQQPESRCTQTHIGILASL